MPIVSVNYSKKFTIGPYLTESIGAEMTLGENQCPIDALAGLAKLTDDFHRQNNPNLFGKAPQPPEPEILPVTEVEKPIGRSMVEQIMSSGDMKILESYKIIVKNNAEWKAAYDLRFEQIKAIEIKDILDRTNTRISEPTLKTLSEKNKKIITNA